MDTIDSMQVQFPDYIDNANTVKSLVLTKLYNDGIISEELFKKYEEMQVILFKESWYKKLFTGENWQYRYVDIK